MLSNRNLQSLHAFISLLLLRYLPTSEIVSSSASMVSGSCDKYSRRQPAHRFVSLHETPPAFLQRLHVRRHHSIISARKRPGPCSARPQPSQNFPAPAASAAAARALLHGASCRAIISNCTPLLPSPEHAPRPSRPPRDTALSSPPSDVHGRSRRALARFACATRTAGASPSIAKTLPSSGGTPTPLNDCSGCIEPDRCAARPRDREHVGVQRSAGVQHDFARAILPPPIRASSSATPRLRVVGRGDQDTCAASTCRVTPACARPAPIKRTALRALGFAAGVTPRQSSIPIRASAGPARAPRALLR